MREKEGVPFCLTTPQLTTLQHHGKLSCCFRELGGWCVWDRHSLLLPWIRACIGGLRGDTLWPGQDEENHSTTNPLWFTEPYPSIYNRYSRLPLNKTLPRLAARVFSQKPAKHSRQYPTSLYLYNPIYNSCLHMLLQFLFTENTWYNISQCWCNIIFIIFLFIYNKLFSKTGVNSELNSGIHLIAK